MESIREAIDHVAPDLSDYFLLSELDRILKMTHAKIYYALSKSKSRPLYAVKRGDRWFVHRLDALAWAQGVSRDARLRMEHNEIRFEKILTGKSRPQQKPPTVAPRPGEHVPGEPVRGEAGRIKAWEAQRSGRRWPAPPDGQRLYTYMEAAIVMRTTIATVSVYLSPTGALAHAQRFTIEGNRVAIDADAIDAFQAERERKAAEAKERKREDKAAKDARAKQQAELELTANTQPEQPVPPPKEERAPRDPKDRRKRLQLVEKGAA